MVGNWLGLYEEDSRWSFSLIGKTLACHVRVRRSKLLSSAGESMIPYGKRKIKHNFEDYHPPKGYVNWWELEMALVNKKRERQRAKKEIQEELSREMK